MEGLGHDRTVQDERTSPAWAVPLVFVCADGDLLSNKEMQVSWLTGSPRTATCHGKWASDGTPGETVSGAVALAVRP